jgi:3-oxoadipate enol-lactonase
MRQHVTIDGRRLSYLDSASLPGAERVSGRALVLVHAFPLSADMWRRQASELPSGWRLVAPDLRGFGESEPDSRIGAGATMDDYAGDVFALLDRLDIESAVIGGLSMGGYVTFAMFRKAPERFLGMILANTKSGADTGEARERRLQMLRSLTSDGPAAIVEGLVPKLLGSTTLSERPAVVETVRRIASGSTSAGIYAAVQRMMDRPDSTHLLADVRCPTLIVVGEEDELTPVDEARNMHGQVLGAELAIIGSAGHLSNLERPDEFDVALARFLSVHFSV